MSSNNSSFDLILYERPLFGIANYFSAVLYVAVITALQTSKDKAHHTAFFTIYKVTAFYGITNILTSYDFDLCIQTTWAYKVLELVNTTGSFCFVTGNLFIEIQRYLVLRRANFDENISFRRLLLLFSLQFLFFIAVQSPIFSYGVEYDEDGCINDVDGHYQRILRSFVAFFYCSYVVASVSLTTLTIRRMRVAAKLNKSGRGLHLSLVRYSIYCSFAQMSKGAVQLTSSFALFTHNEAAKSVHLILYYPINFTAVNSTLFLLLFFSKSVRRRVLQVYHCKSAPKLTSVGSKTDDTNAKAASAVTPIQ